MSRPGRPPPSRTPCSSVTLDLTEWDLAFEPSLCGETIANILALDGGGHRLLPLVNDGGSAAARAALGRCSAAELFPAAFAPEAALSGLWLYFSCFEECHGICQDLSSAEGSYWHAILHRLEPDAANAGYWFRRVGDHPIFPALLEAAREIAARYPDPNLPLGRTWDPVQFIEFCERARRQSASAAVDAAREVQRAEWQLLFDYCARPH